MGSPTEAESTTKSAPQTSTTTSDTESNHEVLAAKLSRAVLRKIDWRLLPIMFVTYNLNFIDKTILSSASVLGLKTDLGLVGQQYSWVSSMFYFGYLFWEYPATLLIQRLPVAKFLAADLFLWGIIVAATAACTSFGGIATARFLLGCVEAAVSPTFLYVTAMWYTRSEMASRTAVWFAGNSFGGFVANVVGYGIGHIEDGKVTAWQWLFIIFGLVTFLWSSVVFFFLPDTIRSAGFLTEDEKLIAEERVVLEGTGKAVSDFTQWKREQVIECLTDPKTLMFFAISLLTQIPNGGTTNFGLLVLETFGFSNLDSMLIQIPASAIAITAVMGSGFICSKFKNVTTYMIVAVILPPVIGSAIIYSSSTPSGAKLFGYYALTTGSSALPLSMSLVAANYRGVTKKMTMTAILFVAYSAGNIAGPQFFLDSESDIGYPTAFRAILISYALAMLTAMVLRFYCLWMNKKKEREEGEAVVEVVVGEDAAVELVEADHDTTDLKTRGFRYIV